MLRNSILFIPYEICIFCQSFSTSYAKCVYLFSFEQSYFGNHPSRKTSFPLNDSIPPKDLLFYLFNQKCTRYTYRNAEELLFFCSFRYYYSWLTILTKTKSLEKKNAIKMSFLMETSNM